MKAMYEQLGISSGVYDFGKKIEDSFVDCDHLSIIFCKALTPPTLWGGWAEDVNVYVPKESVELYKSAAGWKYYNIIGYDF